MRDIEGVAADAELTVTGGNISFDVDGSGDGGGFNLNTVRPGRDGVNDEDPKKFYTVGDDDELDDDAEVNTATPALIAAWEALAERYKVGENGGLAADATNITSPTRESRGRIGRAQRKPCPP